MYIDIFEEKERKKEMKFIRNLLIIFLNDF